MRQKTAQGALADVLEELKPWQDPLRVSGALTAWAVERGWEIDPIDVAELLRTVGQTMDALPSGAQVARVASGWLQNVQEGREPTHYDGMQNIHGLEPWTRPRYVKAHGNDATETWLRRKMEYPAKLHQLMIHDRSESAARRWIQRYPAAWPACSVSAKTSAPPWRLLSARYRCRTLAQYRQRHRPPDDSPVPDPAHRRPQA